MSAPIPPLEPPDLSLVTGAMDRPQSLDRLIRSIQRHTRVTWELIIADASELPLYISDPRITRLIERPRLGHTKGYNRAFAECKGTWVIWLNDDAEVLPGYDTTAINFMHANPQIGLGALPYSELRAGVWSKWHTNNWRGLPYANFGIIAREFGNQLGWFDEEFMMYGADNSLAFRTLLAGKGISPIPHAYLLHHSPQDEIRAGHQKWRVQCGEIFDRKYNPLYEQMARTYRLNKVHEAINLPYTAAAL